jgi:chitinase
VVVHFSEVDNVGTDQTVPLKTIARLDGSMSLSTTGAPLVYQWHVDSAPAGSTAFLSSTSAAMPTLLPNVEGTYTLSLIVRDNSCVSAPSLVHVSSVNSAPVANAGPNQSSPRRSVVTLDGSASSDPNGDPISYAWTLSSKPAGSTAALSSATAAKPTFTADLAGSYVATLAVSDGRLTSPLATVTITALNTPPVAVAGPAQYTNVGGGVTLDGSASSDPDGDAITFAWAILSAPAGSAAALTGATTSRPGLTPDLEGAYTVQLTVSDGVNSATASVTVTAYRKIAALAYRPVDAEYSRSLERIVMVSASPAALHIYDPVGGTDQSVTLNLAPQCVSVSPDGKFAAVGHNAWISYVDLTTATLVRTVAVTADVGDVVIGNPMTVSAKTTRFAYAFPRVDQWVTIHTVDLTTGVETLAGSSAIYAGTRAKLQFGSLNIFGTTNGISPASLEKYLIGASGTATYGSRVFSAGGSNLWVTDDGVSILFADGSRYRTTDMSVGGALPDTTCVLSADAPASPSTAAGKVLVVPDGVCYAYPPNPANDDTVLRVYDTAYLNLQQTTALPRFGLGSASYAAHGRYAYFGGGGAKQFAVVQADPSSSLLNDFGIVVY